MKTYVVAATGLPYHPIGLNPPFGGGLDHLRDMTHTESFTERVKDGDAWKDATEWFRVTLFGKTAENAAQYLEKGRQVYVEGRLKTDKYKDKDGVERTSVEVVANTIQFLGGGAGKGPRTEVPATDGAPPASDGFVDDDLPFNRSEFEHTLG